MHQTIQKVESNYRKKQVVDVRSGDTVRVHQKIKEGNKERVQVFEGFVIRTDRKNSLTSRITVRRIASGVGVEKSFMLHSPLVTKVEVVKRAKVRRKNLSYMRSRSGKSARLAGVDFDKDAVNTLDEIMDKEVGEAEETQNTDVTKKEKKEEALEASEEKAEEKPADDEVKEEKAEKAEEKPAEEKKEEAPKAEKPEEPKEEKKELSKKEKAEAFRKAQEEKKK
jgi:large subunit ribosomal protein L19